MKSDPQLPLELLVAAEYRLSHSEFLRWSATDRDKLIGQYLRRVWGSW